MDAWGWSALGPWLAERAKLPVGPLFCVMAGPTHGHAWSASAAMLQLQQMAHQAGVRRRFAPHHYADPLVMPTLARKSVHVGMTVALTSA